MFNLSEAVNQVVKLVERWWLGQDVHCTVLGSHFISFSSEKYQNFPHLTPESFLKNIKLSAMSHKKCEEIP